SARHCCLRDVADRAFAIRAASQGRARQPPQGGVPRRPCAPVSPRRVRDLGSLRRGRRGNPRLSRRSRRPRVGLLDAVGPARVHGGGRGVFPLFWAHHPRAPPSPSSGPTASPYPRHAPSPPRPFFPPFVSV